MDRLLAPDFFEIGCSGRVWTRDQILDMPAQPIPARLPFNDVAIHPIGERVVQVTYTSRVAYDEPRVCRRSSIWVATTGGWRLRFHQGTPVPGHGGRCRIVSEGQNSTTLDVARRS